MFEHLEFSSTFISKYSRGGTLQLKIRGPWLDSLGSEILAGKIYFGVLQKY